MSIQAGTVETAAPVSRSIPSRERITVLLVEDEKFVREAAGHILECAGYRVCKARNAAEARREFGFCGGEVQVLLIDMVLPDCNGSDLAKELGAARPEMRTVLMSGYPEQTLGQQSDEDTAVLYLAKPFSVESLTAKINEAERRHVETRAPACAVAES